jgi:hypothetical protein
MNKTEEITIYDWQEVFGTSSNRSMTLASNNKNISLSSVAKTNKTEFVAYVGIEEIEAPLIPVKLKGINFGIRLTKVEENI